MFSLRKGGKGLFGSAQGQHEIICKITPKIHEYAKLVTSSQLLGLIVETVFFFLEPPRE